jgi:hypothetical protein
MTLGQRNDLFEIMEDRHGLRSTAGRWGWQRHVEILFKNLSLPV